MRILVALLALLSTLAAVSNAHALGIRLDDIDPLATARGNAFTATADMPAAIYYNPAGITQIDQPTLTVGAYAVFFDVDYRSTNGEKHRNDAEFQHAPFVHFTLPVETTPVTFGFSTHVPFGLRNDWPEDTDFSSIATESEFRYIRHSPVLAWRIVPGVSVAAGLTLNSGKADLRRQDPNFGEVVTEARGQDFGYVLGAHWHPAERHAFGATYRSRNTFDLSGTVTAGGMSSSAEAEFPFPDVVVAGYSFRPTEAWNIEFNIDWTNWDVLDTVTVETEDFGDTDMEFHWKSSFIYKLGATRFFDNGYRVSAGYMFSENSVPDDHFNPAVPDADRHLLSAGLGYTIAGLSWDLAYQFGYSSTRKVRGSEPGPADGDYQPTVHAFSASLSYAF